VGLYQLACPRISVFINTCLLLLMLLMLLLKLLLMLFWLSVGAHGKFFLKICLA